MTAQKNIHLANKYTLLDKLYSLMGYLTFLICTPIIYHIKIFKEKKGFHTMKLRKTIGRILVCLLPFLLAFALQFLISFGGIFVRIMLAALKDPGLLKGEELYSTIFALTSDSQFLAGVSALYAVIAALIMGFWYWKRFVPKKRPRRKISSIINLSMFFGLLFLMIGLQYLTTYIVMLTTAVNPSWYDIYEALLKNIGFEDVTLILALYSVLIAPISEELIFRGVTLKYAVNSMPLIAANIFQAALFGIFHGNVIQGVYAFVIGLFCGYVCLKGGSIYLSILFHMMFNLWGTFVPSFLYYTGPSLPIHLGIFAGAVCAAALGIFLYQRGIRNRKASGKS